MSFTKQQHQEHEHAQSHDHERSFLCHCKPPSREGQVSESGGQEVGAVRVGAQVPRGSGRVGRATRKTPSLAEAGERELQVEGPVLLSVFFACKQSLYPPVE